MNASRVCKLILGPVALWGCVASLCAADVFSVDMDLATPGIQSSRVVKPGDVFTVGLVLNVDAAGVSSYGVSVEFDSTELKLNGAPAAVVPVLPGGLSPLITPVENNALGRVYSFTGATFGNGPASTSFTVGTISFQVQSTVNDGLPDISLGLFNLGVDGLFNNAGTPVTPTFQPGYLLLVPEPGTLVLGFCGALWLWAVRRRVPCGREGAQSTPLC
jgi:hypothetical protein